MADNLLQIHFMERGQRERIRQLRQLETLMGSMQQSIETEKDKLRYSLNSHSTIIFGGKPCQSFEQSSSSCRSGAIFQIRNQ